MRLNPSYKNLLIFSAYQILQKLEDSFLSSEISTEGLKNRKVKTYLLKSVVLRFTSESSKHLSVQTQQ